MRNESVYRILALNLPLSFVIQNQNLIASFLIVNQDSRHAETIME